MYLKQFRQYVDTVEHFGLRPGETIKDIEQILAKKKKDMKSASDDELSRLRNLSMRDGTQSYSSDMQMPPSTVS